MNAKAVDSARISELAEKQKDALIALRQELHANPELSWQEVETSKMVEQRLSELGFEKIRRGFKGTDSGVTAELTGGRTVSNEEAPPPCVALRADLDALPITEETDVSFASTVEGVMHACGHDAHTTILLGVADVLAQMKDQFAGRIRLLFQPAEEAGTDSGAPALIDEGALDGVDAAAGLHVWAQLPFGVLGFRKGTLLASADIWEVVLQGEGGHGAMPHTAVDPTVAAAHLISMLQTVVSREIDPLDSAVVSVGKIESGDAPNVIPDKATIKGNIRTTNRNTRSEMENRIRRIVEGVSSALRCTAELTYTPIYPVTVNDDELTDLYTEIAAGVLGAENVREVPIAMGSEDFSYYGEHVPAAFVILGMGDAEEGTDKPHHSPHFKTHDDILVPAVKILTTFALRFLATRGQQT
ncbi:MAG: M20 metallopeptidase family protein [Spirochaetota bacterium]